MIATELTHSLSELQNTAEATIARLNETGDAEIITVDGQARAILLSPAAYEEMATAAETARDVATIRNAMKEFEEGKGRPVSEFSAALRAELMATKDKQQEDAAR